MKVWPWWVRSKGTFFATGADVGVAVVEEAVSLPEVSLMTPA